MKKLLLLTVLLTLAGCFGPTKFDATNEASIKESSQKIIKELNEEQREEFGKAIMYFTIGGEKGIGAMMAAAFAGKPAEKTAETMISTNLHSIDGLNGEQILKKYRANLERDRIKREKEEAERKKISQLEKEADELLKGKKFEEALAKYKAMSEISSGAQAAEIGIENATKEMKAFTDKTNYLDKIEITEFEAKRIDTYRKKGVPAVRISLKNKGDRSLDKVEVAVYFQDKEGNTIFEKTYLPVLVSRYSFSGDNSPLKPGYVREAEQNKYYTLDSKLSEWQEGKAFAKVVDIKFSKEI